MARFFQYLAKQQSVFTPDPPEKTLYPPWSEPVHRRVGVGPVLGVALVASGFVGPVFVPTPPAGETTVSGGATFQRSIIYQSLAYTPFVPPAQVTPVFNTPTDVTCPRSIIYQAKAEPIFISQTGTQTFVPSITDDVTYPKSIIYQVQAYQPKLPDVTVDRWFAPLSEPKRLKRTLQDHILFIAPSETVTLDKWFVPLAEPAKRKRIVDNTALIQAPFTGEVITVDKWFEALSEPTRRKFAAARDPARAAPPFVETVTLDKWFEPLAEPKRLRQQTKEQIAFVATTEVVTVDKWFEPLSEPKRDRARSIALRDQFAWSGFTPTAQTTAFNAPTDVSYQRSIIYQSLAWAPYPVAQQGAASTVESQPNTRTRFQYQKTVEPVFVPTPVVSTDIEVIPISGEPTFQKSIIYQSLAWCPQTIAAQQGAASTVESQPNRLTRFQYQREANPIVVTPFPVGTGTWTQNFVDLVYPRSIIYQSQAWNPYPFPSPVVSTDIEVWPVAGEPTFSKTIIYQSLAWAPYPVAATQGAASTVESQPNRVSRFQYQRTVEPVLVPQTGTGVFTDNIGDVVRPLSVIYQSLAWAPWPVVTEVIFPDKWWEPWSEPVRQKKGLAAYEQQFIAGPPSYPILPNTIPWWKPFDEPVRAKKGLRTNLQQSETHSQQPFVPFSYFNWLTEPVRAKKGLRADEQQFIAKGPDFPNLPRIIPWWQPLSEPVWPKKGLKAYLQSTTVLGTAETKHVIFVTIAATETNADTANFYAVVYNRPIRAVVSFKEIPRPSDAYVSFEET